MKKLPRPFYSRDTITVAKEMLGKFLVKDGMIGKIVETEAYLGVNDKASHASWRKRETCAPIWGPAGYTYIHFTYGMYYMFDIVTEGKGIPASVLIRALEPIILSPAKDLTNSTSGPGRLTKAFGITKIHNNHDLTTSDTFYIAKDDSTSKIEIVETTRIGIDYAKEYKSKLWRFYIKGNKFISRK